MGQPKFSCRVRVEFLPERSRHPGGPYAFAYTVTVSNSGDITAQLVARRWTIIDAEGRTEEVRGLAVVGHQPVLAPGEEFEYTSWTQLATPHGRMHGTYCCMTEDAQPFEAEIPAFELVFRGLLH